MHYPGLMNRMFILASLISISAFAKTPEMPPRTFMGTCRNILLFPPIVVENGHAEISVDDRTPEGTGLAQAWLAADGQSLLKPAFLHYGGHRDNKVLLLKLLAAAPHVQEVEITLSEEDMKVYRATPGGQRAKVRATSIYQDFAAQGFKNVFFESTSDQEVQVILSKRGWLWRVLRY